MPEPLEVLIFEATRQVFDDCCPADVQPVSEATQLEFEPILDSETSFAEGHCVTVVRGGERPSYRLAVPGGEFFVHDYTARVMHRMAGTYEVISTGSRTFVRTPQLKAADGVVLVSMAQYTEFGVVALPLDGGKVIEILPDPLAASRPAPPARKAKTPPAERVGTVFVAEPPPALPEPQIVVELGPVPVGPPVKRTQGSLFDLMGVGA